MSIRIKLVSLISAFILVLGLVITGVLAASSQTITMNGSVNFNVVDKSLWVKEVRMQEAGSDPVVISNFTPGYINGDFNFNVGDFENNRGSFALQFDIINTTTSNYIVSVTVPESYEANNIEVSITESIPASESEITTIAPDTPITTTLALTVSNPNLIDINLSDITINFEEIIEGELTYSYNDETHEATVIACREGANSVNIPETVTYNDQIYTVTSIDAGTSSSGPFYSVRDTLKTLTIPSTITSIGTYAFYDCRNLVEINCNAIELTGNYYYGNVFSNAGADGEGITLNIGEGVKSIPSNLFSAIYGSVVYGAKISVLNISSTVEYIGNSFAGISPLTINYNAVDAVCDSFVFYGDRTLRGITLTINVGEGVKKIPDHLFGGAEPGALNTIVSLSLPDSLEEIGAYAFAHSEFEGTLEIPKNVSIIEDNAFYYIGISNIIINNHIIYSQLTSLSACGYLLNNILPGETVKVLKSAVDTVDPDFTKNTYLNGADFTRTVEGDYYVYTHV